MFRFKKYEEEVEVESEIEDQCGGLFSLERIRPVIGAERRLGVGFSGYFMQQDR